MHRWVQAKAPVAPDTLQFSSSFAFPECEGGRKRSGLRSCPTAQFLQTSHVSKVLRNPVSSDSGNIFSARLCLSCRARNGLALPHGPSHPRAAPAATSLKSAQLRHFLGVVLEDNLLSANKHLKFGLYVSLPPITSNSLRMPQMEMQLTRGLKVISKENCMQQKDGPWIPHKLFQTASTPSRAKTKNQGKLHSQREFKEVLNKSFQYQGKTFTSSSPHWPCGTS